LAQKLNDEFFPGGKFGQVICREAAFAVYQPGFWAGAVVGVVDFMVGWYHTLVN